MTALVIKNLPDAVMVGLKARAQANHRSVTKEAVVLLTTGVGEAPPFAAEPAPPFRAESTAVARPDAPVADGRAALRAALVRQPDGGYVNVLGFDGESFDDALSLARRTLLPPQPLDFDTGEPDAPADADCDR